MDQRIGALSDTLGRHFAPRRAGSPSSPASSRWIPTCARPASAARRAPGRSATGDRGGWHRGARSGPRASRPRRAHPSRRPDLGLVPRSRREPELARAAAGGNASIMPTEGFLSSNFAMVRYHPILHIDRPHEGIDITAAYGTPIIASGRRPRDQGRLGERLRPGGRDRSRIRRGDALRPPVAHRGHGRPGAASRRPDRLRRQHRPLDRAAPALRSHRGRTAHGSAAVCHAECDRRFSWKAESWKEKDPGFGGLCLNHQLSSLPAFQLSLRAILGAPKFTRGASAAPGVVRSK